MIINNLIKYLIRKIYVKLKLQEEEIKSIFIIVMKKVSFGFKI